MPASREHRRLSSQLPALLSMLSSGLQGLIMDELIGEYECKLDPKGRIALPAGLLKQLAPEARARFVLGRGIEQHLVLYPYAEWQALAAEIKKLNDFVTRERRFAQRFFAGQLEVYPDAQNRLLLPRRMLAFAEITDTLVISARPNEMASRIELWQPERYDELLAPDEEFARLAQDVMGKKLVIPLDQD